MLLAAAKGLHLFLTYHEVKTGEGIFLSTFVTVVILVGALYGVVRLVLDAKHLFDTHDVKLVSVRPRTPQAPPPEPPAETPRQPPPGP